MVDAGPEHDVGLRIAIEPKRIELPVEDHATLGTTGEGSGIAGRLQDPGMPERRPAEQVAVGDGAAFAHLVVCMELGRST